MKMFTAVALLAFSLAAAPAADALTLKLGSIAPKGSPWELALRRLSAEWARISDGSVTVQVYPAGAAGDESDMIRKMRIGQIQAALVTVSGLQQIWNGVKVLSYPLFIRDDAEFRHVMERLWPLDRPRDGGTGLQGGVLVAGRVDVLLHAAARRSGPTTCAVRRSGSGATPTRSSPGRAWASRWCPSRRSTS